jgi:hypothetical protein
VASHELFRVVRPGGTVAMTAWVPGGFTAELIALGRKHGPPPDPDQPLSEEWGVEATVRERFDGFAASIRCEERQLPQEDASYESFAARFADTAPTMAAARQVLSPDQFDALLDEIRELTDRFNEADGATVRIHSPYLLTVARKRG